MSPPAGQQHLAGLSWFRFCRLGAGVVILQRRKRDARGVVNSYQDEGWRVPCRKYGSSLVYEIQKPKDGIFLHFVLLELCMQVGLCANCCSRPVSNVVFASGESVFSCNFHKPD